MVLALLTAAPAHQRQGHLGLREEGGLERGSAGQWAMAVSICSWLGLGSGEDMGMDMGMDMGACMGAQRGEGYRAKRY